MKFLFSLEMHMLMDHPRLLVNPNIGCCSVFSSDKWVIHQPLKPIWPILRDLELFYRYLPLCNHRFFTTWADSNTKAPDVPFAHNMVLPNPPDTSFKSQQANTFAYTSQIDNSAPWDDSISQFKEELIKNITRKYWRAYKVSIILNSKRKTVSHTCFAIIQTKRSFKQAKQPFKWDKWTIKRIQHTIM